MYFRQPRLRRVREAPRNVWRRLSIWPATPAGAGPRKPTEKIPIWFPELAWPQGKGPYIDKSHVLATLKHFAVHGQPEGGTNVGPGNYSERVVREYFLKPFE